MIMLYTVMTDFVIYMYVSHDILARVIIGTYPVKILDTDPVYILHLLC